MYYTLLIFLVFLKKVDKDIKPLVSICIPTFNSSRFIFQSLTSICKQTYKNIEIIVSDNNSTDNTVEIIKSIMAKDSRIKLNINSRNIGFSANANKLISLANYDYIALFHSDDIYHPTIIEKEMEFLSSNSDLAGCFTESKFIGQNSLELTKEVKHFKSNGTFSIIDFDTYLNFLFKRGGSMFMCPTALIKKSIYQEFNGFDESLKYIDDQDMYLRILLKYNFGIIHSRLINYRIHENQVSKVYSSSSINNLSIVYKHLIDFVEGNNEIKINYQLKLKKSYCRKIFEIVIKTFRFSKLL
jgi:glycosyltransferase involved in cell wall biosynthesis